MSSDPRFLHLRHDPRFRRPKKRKSQIVQDKRFQVNSRTHEEEAKATEGPTVSIADYARGIILMESSDEEGEERDHVSVDVHESEVNEEEVEPFHSETDRGEAQEEVQKTRRLAVVNMDWDHIRAVHLFKIFSSLVSSTAPPSSQSSTVNIARGSILSVRVYPSEFGKKRIEKEEQEGPPKEVFKKLHEDEDEVSERTVYEPGSGEDYDEDALRVYQLERLRYYYAIVECDSAETATHIFNELDGTELERSANVFDLSLVPDDMTFEEDPRDEATELPNVPYRAIEFATDALRHSKVKLTWDEEDPERSRLTRCALTRKDIDAADFKAYIASSSESEDNCEDSNSKIPRKGERERLRALLLGGSHDGVPEGWEDAQEAEKVGEAGSDVDMEITFTPGLSTAKDCKDQTTLERYEQKVREKRRRRKEVRKAAASEDTAKVDPHTEVVKPRTKKKKRNDDNIHDDGSEAEADFLIDVKDDRFKALHEDHQFAIDPSNPQFKKTKGMLALLEERSKRRRDDYLEKGDVSAKNLDTNDGRSLHNLAERVKRKTNLARDSSVGKRRKL
ncbi:hypothetical protein F5J12DRAFT_820928 [Pisolithus orientalis]|uniref:uncharacterized protein n=1 Tax=Pisolithus orientalis TaxID=936130 RepID=UPI002225B091|nr:uncharacterized protein F5J12DRAFT_820928 [Pisolithus orientalis]KAI6010656.1 hypothetical protein F5J12DRAFT_820928 [Pisolithus orientalis]